MTLSTLCNNFREIYNAAHTPGNADVRLVPSLLRPLRVFNAHQGRGRLWRVCNGVAALFLKKDFMQRRLERAMLHTQMIFQDQLTLMHGYIEAYHKYLNEKSAGYPVNERDFHQARRAITQWSPAAVPFLEYVRQGVNDKLTKIFQTYYPTTITEGKDPFACGPEIETLKELQQIIALEGVLHEPLPLQVLEKLATGKILSDSDNKTLNQWINKLNRLGSKVNIGLFHDAMTAFVHFLCTREYPRPPSLIDMELTLARRNLALFSQEDPEHLRWSNSLRQYDILECCGEKIILGKAIGDKLAVQNLHIVFYIQNDEERVVYFSINSAILAIREHIARDESGLIPYACILDIDPTGRCAFMEKLHISLENHPWESKGSSLTPEDEDLVIPVAELVQYMVRNESTPKTLSTENLMFNNSGQLRYTKICEPDEFDYTALEDFLIECANGNKLVYINLMNLSTLLKHSYHDFFKRMVQDALKGTQPDFEHLRTIYKVTGQAEDRGKALYDEVLQLKEACCQCVNARYYITDTKDLLTEVKEQIKEQYKLNHHSSRLGPTMAVDVAEAVAKAMKLQSRASP